MNNRKYIFAIEQPMNLDLGLHSKIFKIEYTDLKEFIDKKYKEDKDSRKYSMPLVREYLKNIDEDYRDYDKKLEIYEKMAKEINFAYIYKKNKEYGTALFILNKSYNVLLDHYNNTVLYKDVYRHSFNIFRLVLFTIVNILVINYQQYKLTHLFIADSKKDFTPYLKHFHVLDEWGCVFDEIEDLVYRAENNLAKRECHNCQYGILKNWKPPAIDCNKDNHVEKGEEIRHIVSLNGYCSYHKFKEDNND